MAFHQITFQGGSGEVCAAAACVDVDLSPLALRPDPWVAHVLLARAAASLVNATVDPTDVFIVAETKDGRSRRVYLYSDAADVSLLLHAALIRIVVSTTAAKTTPPRFKLQEPPAGSAVAHTRTFHPRTVHVEWHDDDGSAILDRLART